MTMEEQIINSVWKVYNLSTIRKIAIKAVARAIRPNRLADLLEQFNNFKNEIV